MANLESIEYLQKADRKLSKVINKIGFLGSSINSYKDSFSFLAKEIEEKVYKYGFLKR